MSEKPIRRKVAAVTTAMLAAATMSGELQAHTQETRSLSPAAGNLLLRSAEADSADIKPVFTPLPFTSFSARHERYLSSAATSIEQLPGYGERVGSAEAKLIRDATVRVVSGGEAATGFLLINRKGKIYVYTVAHLFKSVTGDKAGRGLLPLDGAPYYGQNRAVDFALSSNNTYETIIQTATSPHYQLGEVNGISIYPKHDSALLKLDSATVTAKFKNLKPLDGSKLFNQPAKPGVEFAMYGLSRYTRQPESGKGIYLGRTTNEEGQLLDVIATSAPNYRAVKCTWGGSGMTAVSRGGNFLGGESRHLSKLLSPEDFENIKNLSGGQVTTKAGALENIEYWWNRYTRQQLGVEVPSRYTDLCMYAAPKPLDGMVAGFGRYPSS